MKKIIIIIAAMVYAVSLSAKTNINGSWVLDLQRDRSKQTITLKQKGTSITGRLKNGGRFSGTWNSANNKMTGFLNLSNSITNPKLYGFEVKMKNNTQGNLLIGKYCECVDGKKNLRMTLKRIIKKVPTVVKVDGSWSTTIGSVKLRRYSNNKILGDLDDKVSINARIYNNNMIKGEIRNIDSRQKKQYFEWKMVGNKFTGKFGFNKNNLNMTWNGTLLKSYKPRLKNFPKASVSKISRLIPKQKIVAKKDYSGRYRVTVTKLHTFSREVYGSIGIRMKGKSKSGAVVLNSVGNKKPRIWDVKSSYPVASKSGQIEVDQMREFIIKGELANSNLIVNIQANLSEKSLLTFNKLGWKQRNLYLKDMKLGKEYFLALKNNRVLVGFKLEKI